VDRRLFLKLFGVGATYPLQGFATPSPSIVIETRTATASSEAWPLDEPNGTKITLVACGGAGIAMTRNIDKSKYGFQEIVALDTSKRSLINATHADRTFLITNEKVEKPTSANSACHWAGEQHNEIRQMLGDTHMVIIITTLGGSAGTGIANIVNQVAMNSGILTLGFADLPFAFEDSVRQENARLGLDAFVKNTDNTMAMSNSRLLASLGPDSTVDDLLQESSTALKHYLWNTCGCLTNAGLVGIDFEDVRTIFGMRGENCVSTMGWGEARGIDRGKIAAKHALAHPLLQPFDATKIKGVSVSIRAGNNNLKFREINSVMNEINSVMPDESYVVFSANHDESLVDILQVSLILIPY
jgi:cell division protein FtsZ